MSNALDANFASYGIELVVIGATYAGKYGEEGITLNMFCPELLTGAFPSRSVCTKVKEATLCLI